MVRADRIDVRTLDIMASEDGTAVVVVDSFARASAAPRINAGIRVLAALA
ncbi:hypothetical protein [Rathayibacter sp. AY1C7]|nr:hypothetical protein [Rathayibacter sp. AY1C7]